jgi:hypothetical protein
LASPVSSSAPSDVATGGPTAAKTVAASGEDRDEDDDDAARQGGAIVVTAHALDDARSRMEPALGATVYSLGNEAIENRPGGETGSLASVLAQAPGVTPGSSLTVRGAPVNQVRINNVAIPEAIADPADHLSARLAETTRLLTGALPAQYGFAPAGVISVTTKNGLYQHGGQAELFAGTGGMIEPALEWAGSSGATSLFASGSFEHDRSVVADTSGTSLRQWRDQFEGLGFADHLIDADNRLSLIIGGSSELRRYGDDGAVGRERSDDGYGVATFQHSSGADVIQASVFAGFANDRASFARPSRESRRSVGTQVDVTAELAQQHTARFGLFVSHGVRSETDSGSSSHAERTSLSVYGQDEWQLARGLTFNPGVRVEWLQGPSRAAAFEPRASLVWQDDGGLSLHIGYARFASAPPLGEDGSSALADERDDYFDAGVQRRLGALTLNLDGYLRKVRNLVQERMAVRSTSGAAYAFRSAQMRGVELSATYRRGETSAWLNLALAKGTGMGLIDPAGVFAPPAPGPGRLRLSSDRPFTMSGGFTRRMGPLIVSADMQASSGAVTSKPGAAPNGSRHPAYTLVGVAAVYHADVAGHAADLRIDVTNIFGVRAVLADATARNGGWTRQVAPRAISAGLELAF